MDLACSALSALRLRASDVLGRLRGPAIRYSGSYPTWNEAKASAQGWEQAEILEKVASAAAKVARGEAASERDSVTFEHIDYAFPVMAALLRAALENGGRISVLDFGGSLGSSYRQFRAFAPARVEVQWYVVEQETFVRRGKSEFESDGLHFCLSAEEAAARSRPDVVLVSSVLQYLDRPDEALKRLSLTGSRYMVLDRTPFSAASEDRLTVQHVPPEIYEASYACRIFSYSRFMSSLAGWDVIADFPSLDGWCVAGSLCFRHAGMLLRRKARAAEKP
jgi:putative methyltransferase (TIGR04325 family)